VPGLGASDRVIGAPGRVRLPASGRVAVLAPVAVEEVFVDLVVYDDDEKRYVPWAVALTALLLVALLTAGLTFLLARQASGSEEPQAVGGVSSPEPATAPTTPAPASATAAPACEEALLRADAALTRAEAVEQALADHTAIVDELLAERITADQALDRSLPVLTDGATDRRLLDEALTAYREAREECAA
jgi:hypothetical protein